MPYQPWRAYLRKHSVQCGSYALILLIHDPQTRISIYRNIQTEVQRSSPYVIALQARTGIVVRSGVQGYFQGVDADMAYYDRVSK